MAKEIHKGTEFHNINETWDENERKRETGQAGASDNTTAPERAEGNDLEQTIKKEAAAYDNANKEERTLSGDRATINDDSKDDASGQ